MAKRIFSTPSSDDFFSCPEFIEHKQSWLIWPERTDNWRMGAKPAQKIVAEIANILIDYEEVNIIVSKNQFQNARQQLNEKIKIIEMTTNDCLIRDFGPLFLINSETKVVRGLKSTFNAWGGTKYGVYYPWDDDDMLSYKIFELEKLNYYELPIILEWGMILLDGKSTCFASEEGILSELRNPNLTKEQAENYLKDYLNVSKIIWLPSGLPYDQTKGRLNNLLTLVDETTILLSWTTDIYDECFQVVSETEKILKKTVNAYGKSYKIIKVLLPKIKNRSKEETEMIDFNINHNPNAFDQSLVGSYTNLYITNRAVLVPTFDDEESQAQALAELAKIFINKRIILVNSRELLLGHVNLQNIICHQSKIM
ncbi:agmatine deiminase family protein [Spiroplasma platyhelix]|uniref:Agmatine deiminase n=1 Tax=Spiroplasma platyhelix PALS-1 TaxID=1276218 RepID=A0A846TZM5_9MOLU|nr:agmatine deiminase family protein [Spiroplasma platyhelix]MBE4703851.1 putative agmatine deiminase [Spiroplasma platyhelix PALS-1]NKE38224.1 agmatine deiminase [Spiroplasma platyhelix PALS-1]UJB29109.1 agmatine deiminase [Spiroplasma platyhelix PALS-1]